MVGPVDSEQRASFALKVKVAFSLLVGLSAGTITLQGDVSLAVTAAAVLAGVAVGALLIWYVFPGTGEVARNDGDGRGGRRR
jgi:hypothetical protein